MSDPKYSRIALSDVLFRKGLRLNNTNRPVFCFCCFCVI